LSSSALPSLIQNTPFLNNGTNLSPEGVYIMESLFPSLYVFGNAFGCLILPPIVNSLGYKLSLILHSIGILGMQLFCVLSVDYEMLLVGRFFSRGCYWRNAGHWFGLHANFCESKS